jgi:hypothetical protein
LLFNSKMQVQFAFLARPHKGALKESSATANDIYTIAQKEWHCSHIFFTACVSIRAASAVLFIFDHGFSYMGIVQECLYRSIEKNLVPVAGYAGEQKRHDGNRFPDCLL